MLVATFGPSTAWVGKKITHDNGQFMLEGHGAITLLNVVEYDRQGHLIWSNDTTRSWVGSLAKAQAARPTQVATVPNEVAFATARYLGGSTLFGPPTKGRLSVTAQHVGVGFNLYVRVPMSAISSVQVSGGQVPKSKVAATVAFGILGALGSSGTMERTDLLVHTKQGEIAAFQVDGKSPLEVRAAIAPILKSVGVPFHDELAQAVLQAGEGPMPADNATVSVADEIAKLAALQASGAITDEEFAAFKAKLMG